MKIGMLCTSLPHRADPVAGRFVAEMASALVARGHRVRLVAARRRGPDGWDDVAAPQGVEARAVSSSGASLLYDGGAPERLGSPAGAVRAVSLSASLASAAAREFADCDALVSHFLVPSAVIAGALRAGRPHLAVCHGSDARLFARLPAWVRERTLGAATARWYVHPGLRDLVDPSDAGAIVCPMGFAPVRRAEPSSGSALRIATVSRLVAVKDVARAVAAVGIARGRGADLRLEVIGDGPLGGALRTQAAGVGEAVRFHGALDARARDAVLGSCDVLLHTARALPDGRTEGAPLAVLESMAAGRCVVATAAGGVPWLLGDAGVLLPEDASPERVADALLALTRNERIALGDKAMRRAEGWSWDAIAARVERALGG